MARQSTKKAKEAEAENAVKEEVKVKEDVNEMAPVEEVKEQKTPMEPVESENDGGYKTPNYSAPNYDKPKYEVSEPVEEEEVSEPVEADLSNEPAEEKISAEESDNKDVDEPVSADEGLSNEKILEIAEALNEAKKVQEIKELTPNTATVLKSEISKLENLEEEIRKDIELKESVLSEENKCAADKLFRRGFTEFWNGVSDGWNN